YSGQRFKTNSHFSDDTMRAGCETLGPRNGVPTTQASRGAPRGDERMVAHTSSGQGTMVDLTVFIPIPSFTPRETPSCWNGEGVWMWSHGYLSRARSSMSTPSGRSLAVKAHDPSTLRSLAQMRCQDVAIEPASVNCPIST